MSITPSSSGPLGPMRFDSDAELFSWMRKNTKGKYATAKAAVAAWWKAVTESLYYADVHFGWDALDPDSCSGKVMPLELAEWCVDNGLDTDKKISKARAIYRASLLTNSPIEYLIDEVGVTKTHTIGERSKDETSASNLLHVAQTGATDKQLRKQPLYNPTIPDPEPDKHRDPKEKSSPEHNSTQEIAELKAQLAKAEAEVRNAKAVKPETIIKEVEVKVTDSSLAEEVSRLNRELALKEVQNDEQKKQLDIAKKARIKALEAKKELEEINATSYKEMSREDPLTRKTVRDRKSGIKSTISEFHGQAAVFDFVKSQPDDGVPGIAQLQGELMDAIKDWVEVLDLYYVEELHEIIQQQLNRSNTQALTTITTIDV